MKIQKNYFKHLTRNIAGALIISSFLVGTIGLCSSGKKREPLNINPPLGTIQIHRSGYDTGRGFFLKTFDKENKREVFFYDHGYDGTLDEVGIFGWTNSEGTYATHNPLEIKKWESDYQRVRKLQSGEFEPNFEHFNRNRE